MFKLFILLIFSAQSIAQINSNNKIIDLRSREQPNNLSIKINDNLYNKNEEISIKAIYLDNLEYNSTDIDNIALPIGEISISTIIIILNNLLDDYSFLKIKCTDPNIDFNEQFCTENNLTVIKLIFSNHNFYFSEKITFTLLKGIFRYELTSFSINVLSILSLTKTPIVICEKGTNISISTSHELKLINEIHLYNDSKTIIINDIFYVNSTNYVFTLYPKYELNGTFYIKIIFGGKSNIILDDKISNLIFVENLYLQNINIDSIQFNDLSFLDLPYKKSKNISKIELYFKEYLSDERISISNSKNYSFDHECLPNEHKIIIYTLNFLQKFEDSIIITIIDNYKSIDNKINISINPLKLIYIIPEKLVVKKNETQIKLIYNCYLSGLKSINLIDNITNTTKKEILKKEAKVEKKFDIYRYTFHILKKDNLNGKYNILTSFENDELSFFEKSFNLNISNYVSCLIIFIVIGIMIIDIIIGFIVYNRVNNLKIKEMKKTESLLSHAILTSHLLFENEDNVNDSTFTTNKNKK